ncbi:hypothetical protein [Xanthomonas axonopodis]|uniref:hypothetical protein n=1 Tax=Xanthomonas axonopodis TaxID=53413 RepID=UPI003556AB0E
MISLATSAHRFAEQAAFVAAVFRIRIAMFPISTSSAALTARKSVLAIDGMSDSGSTKKLVDY